MRKQIAVVFAAAAMAFGAGPQTFTGLITDNMCDTGDHKRSTFESLAIVELTKSGKDTGQKERNHGSTSSGRVGH